MQPGVFTGAKLKLTIDEFFVYGVAVIANIVGTPCNKKKMLLEDRAIFSFYEVDVEELNLKVLPLPKIVPDYCWQDPIFAYKIVRLESNLNRKRVETAL